MKLIYGISLTALLNIFTMNSAEALSPGYFACTASKCGGSDNDISQCFQAYVDQSVNNPKKFGSAAKNSGVVVTPDSLSTYFKNIHPSCYASLVKKYSDPQMVDNAIHDEILSNYNGKQTSGDMMPQQNMQQDEMAQDFGGNQDDSMMDNNQGMNGDYSYSDQMSPQQGMMDNGMNNYQNPPMQQDMNQGMMTPQNQNPQQMPSDNMNSNGNREYKAPYQNMNQGMMQNQNDMMPQANNKSGCMHKKGSRNNMNNSMPNQNPPMNGQGMDPSSNMN